MLRNLYDEIVRRRLWPIPLAAVLVALAAPLLFLKSGPDGAGETATPTAAKAGKLPPRAARLLATTDAATGGRGATGAAQDPFAPPASARATAAAASAGPAGAAGGASAGTSAGTGAGASTKPVPVVIAGAGASSPRSAGSTATGTPVPAASNASPARRTSVRTVAVDIRYASRKDSRLRRAIPRLRTFFAEGKLVAVFVKYSPSRRKAVFAVAPNVIVKGVRCRRQDGVCRYVDIPAGGYARLYMITPQRTIVHRRLDVVHIRRTRSETTATTARAASDNACLLNKLRAMKLTDAPIERDACER